MMTDQSKKLLNSDYTINCDELDKDLKETDKKLQQKGKTKYLPLNNTEELYYERVKKVLQLGKPITLGNDERKTYLILCIWKQDPQEELEQISQNLI